MTLNESESDLSIDSCGFQVCVADLSIDLSIEPRAELEYRLLRRLRVGKAY